MCVEERDCRGQKAQGLNLLNWTNDQKGRMVVSVTSGFSVLRGTLPWDATETCRNLF
jgi:hypothetical protein